MYTSCSTHVQALDFIFKVSKILAIIPPSSNTNLSKRAIFHKVHVIALAIFFAIASSLPVYFRYESKFFAHSVMLHLTLLNTFSLAVVNISTVFNTSFSNAWTRLNAGFMFLDSRLHHGRRGFFEKCPVRFAIANGLYAISVLHICYVVGFMNSVNDTTIYISSWYSLNVFVLIYSLLTVLKNEYESMNALITESKDAATVKAVAAVLKDVTEDFNALFGWPLLFFAFRGCVQLLSCAYYNLVLNASNSSPVGMIVASNGHGFLLMVPTIVVANSCGRVKAESEKAELLSRKSESEDMQKLAPFLRSNAVKFSAAGFFDMDRSTISGFLTTTVTYLIVLIQFKGVE